MSAVAIIVNMIWTAVAVAAFVMGYLEGRKNRHDRRHTLEAVCFICGDRITFPAHYSRDVISKFMLLHSEWHDRQETPRD